MGLFGKNETLDLAVAGMTCSNCITHVQDALRPVVGVKKVQVDLEAGRASVIVHTGTDRDELVQAVRNAGYAAD